MSEPTLESDAGRSRAAAIPLGGNSISAQSCQFCRRRKIKCDKTLPICNQCTKARQVCIYAPSQRRGRPRNSSTAGGTSEQSKDILLRRIRKLEALVEDYRTGEVYKSPGTDVSDNLSDPLGKLVIGKPYLDDEFWSSKELTEILGDSEDSEYEEDYASPQPGIASDFIWGVTPIVQDLSSFHPMKSQIFHYWQTYQDNCECLLRIIHTPSTEAVVREFIRSDLRSIDPNDELLLFCLYFAAITSLSEEDVKLQFGQERAVLLAQHELAVKHALSRAGFLHTQSFKVLQALVLYLGDSSTVSNVVWNMIGLALRIAQTMGIERDGELFKLSPFDTEMRRRLWYQIIFLDLRTAETRGCLSTFLRYDTRLPTSINDIDLSPEMTEYPKAAAGYNDMTIPLMRYEVARLGRRLQGTGFRDTPLSFATKKKVIEEFQQQLFSKYVHYCLGNGMLPEFSAKTASMITKRTNLLVYQGIMRTATQDEKDWLFTICIEIMEYYEELSQNVAAKKWSWLLKIHTQWHAIAFALSELCDRQPSPQTERAWKVIDATHTSWQPTPDAQGTVICNSVRKLLSKAQRRRDNYSQSSVANSLSPSTIDFSEPLVTPSSAVPTDNTSAVQAWEAELQHSESMLRQHDTSQPFSDLTCIAPSLVGSAPPGFGQAQSFPASSLSSQDHQHHFADPSATSSNLPDWFFAGPAAQNQLLLSDFNAAIDNDMAWAWTDPNPTLAVPGFADDANADLPPSDMYGSGTVPMAGQTNSWQQAQGAAW